MASYTRQSTFADGDTITSALFNNEYNQLLSAFVYASSGTTGHRHDGTTAEGGNIHTIGDQDFLNKIVADSTNNRWGIFVEVSSSAVEQIRVQDGAIVPVTDNDIDLGTSSLEFKDGYFDGTVYADAINFNGTAITSTAAELNILDGVTSTAAELNILDGVTSTAAELNILDGVTSTAEELNILDGVTSTAAELNYNDTGAAVGTVVASKVVTVDANKDVASFRNITLTGELDAGSLDISGNADIDGVLETDGLSINGTVVSSTAAELNILDGVTSTAAELNLLDTASANSVVNSKAVIYGSSGEVAGTLSTAAQANITSLGTLTALQVDNININGNAITSTAGTDLTITPVSGQQIVLDGTIVIDAGVVTGATSITSTAFVGDITGNVTGNTSGTAATVTTAAQTNITSLGTLTALTVDNLGVNGNTITANSGALNLTPATGSAIVLDGTINVDAGVVTGATSITSTAFVGDITGDITGNADTATALATARTIGGTSFDGTANIAVGLATLATTVTVTDSTANTNFPVVFNNESNGLLDDTGALRYNPSTGTLLVPNLVVAGTTSTVDTVTMEASNAIIFEGATADDHETTLTIIDPTADRTINLPNQSGTVPVLAAASNTAVTSTPEELNILDGATVVVGEINALDIGSTAVGTAVASKAVILDSNKDYTGVRNFTLSGELDAGSLDISGDVDVDGTLETDAFSIAGTAVTSTAAELNALDGITAVVGELNALDIGSTAVGTAVASKAVILDSNKDYTGVRNLTISGELDAATLDISSSIDVAGNSVLASVDVTGLATAATFEPDGDTAAGDNAAIGYTAAEGLILTGQGSTNDVTIKNDADADVIEIPTGTTNVTIAGTLGTGGAITSGAGLLIADAGTIGSASDTDAIAISSAGLVSLSATNALKLNAGTTAQRPTGAAGHIRYNSTLSQFEGYGSAWGSLGGGATGGGSDTVFVENSDDVTTDYTITSGKNAMSVGPITVESGVDVTIPSGSRWVIL